MGAHYGKIGKNATSEDAATAEETDESIPYPESSWSRAKMEKWCIDNTMGIVPSEYSNKKKLYTAMRKAWDALPDAE